MLPLFPLSSIPSTKLAQNWAFCCLTCIESRFFNFLARPIKKRLLLAWKWKFTFEGCLKLQKLRFFDTNQESEPVLIFEIHWWKGKNWFSNFWEHWWRVRTDTLMFENKSQRRAYIYLLTLTHPPVLSFRKREQHNTGKKVQAMFNLYFQIPKP